MQWYVERRSPKIFFLCTNLCPKRMERTLDDSAIRRIDIPGMHSILNHHISVDTEI